MTLPASLREVILCAGMLVMGKRRRLTLYPLPPQMGMESQRCVCCVRACMHACEPVWVSACMHACVGVGVGAYVRACVWINKCVFMLLSCACCTPITVNIIALTPSPSQMVTGKGSSCWAEFPPSLIPMLFDIMARFYIIKSGVTFIDKWHYFTHCVMC